MKKLILICLTLAIASLACLEPVAIARGPAPTATEAFVSQTIEPSIVVYWVGEEPGSDSTLTPFISWAGEWDGCAEVIAEIALHMRMGNSANTTILSWLKHGDVVRVISKDHADWWLIERGGVVGYARSIYLRSVDCEVVK